MRKLPTDEQYEYRPISAGEAKKLADSGCDLNITLTNDFAFKKVFRNKKALTGLLCSILGIETNGIVDIEFPDTYLHGEYQEDREGILDVRLVLNGEKKINIEIQVRAFPFWEERSLYYLAKMYTEGLQHYPSDGREKPPNLQ